MTKRDSVTIHFGAEQAAKSIRDFSTFERSMLETMYTDIDDARDWNLAGVKSNIEKFGPNHIRPIMYRPFDWRFTYYTDFSRGYLAYPIYEIGRHMLQPNFCLTTIRKADVIQDWTHAFCLDGIMVHHALSMKEGNYIFPLYLYPAEGDLYQTKRINFDAKLHARILKLAKHSERGEPDEIAVFDYIYGVLHCPAYRETYAEFLKIGFPRIPWPASPDVFWDVSDKGGALRRLHLMEPAAIGETPFPFAGNGSNTVEKVEYRGGAVWINETQRFENAPEISWGFWIGGYQPAQKWLKDRKGRALDYEDVQHYQRILKILAETDRIMQTIDIPLEVAESTD
jgi:hypothetical protein